MWAVETNPFFYRHMLTECVRRKDRRVQYGWTQDLQASLDQWRGRAARRFAGLLATELLLQAEDGQLLLNLADVLEPGADLLSLEPASSEESFRESILVSLGAELEGAFR